MGFPLGYTDFHLPNLLLHFLSILDFLRELISTLLTFLGLHHFLEPGPAQPDFPYLTRSDPNSGFIRKLISTLLTFLGFRHFLEYEFPSPARPEFSDPTRPNSNSGFIIKFISTLLTFLGLHHFHEPEYPNLTRHEVPHPTWPDPNMGFIRKFISTLLTIDFPHPARPQLPHPTRTGFSDPTRLCSVSAGLFRELLPVVRYSEMVDPPESCAVCLYEFDWEDEIRRLMNCCHVFHRSCVDRWMDHDQNTCPLCRKEFILSI